MRSQWRLGVLVFALACTPLNAERPRAPSVDGPVGTLSYDAPGDSLRYTLRWGAGARATSYGVRVTAAPGAWSGIPTNGTTVTTTSYAFTAINTLWDSVRFEAAVWSLDARGRSSRDTARVSWAVVRGPGGPGPITVDSSLIVIGIAVTPVGKENPVTLIAGQEQEYYAILTFYDGKKVLPGYGTTACPKPQADFEQRVPLLARGSAKQQAVADTATITWSVTGGTWEERCG